MVSDWLYLLGGGLLLLSNGIAWMSLFYGLPGNWIICANCLLASALLPAKENGLGIGTSTILIMSGLCLIGDLATQWTHQAHLSNSGEKLPAIRKVMLTTTLGGLMGATPGLLIPIVGLVISVLGAIAGATIGATIGNSWAAARPGHPIEVPAPRRMGMMILRIARIAPSLLVGMVLLMLTYWSMFS
ncbi:MAG: hypothetical protein KDA80_06815 [Planctomycetaceae bacterium]|nr:hypothetical protein [Planctomycetaceae bacterium]